MKSSGWQLLWAGTRRRLPWPSLWMLALLLVPLFTFGCDRWLSRGRALRGVAVGHVHVGGEGSAEIERRIKRYLPKLAAQVVVFQAGERRAGVEVAELGYAPDSSATSQAALHLGREGSSLQQFAWWLSFSRDRQVPWVWKVDTSRRDAALMELEAKLALKVPRAGGIVMDGARPSPVYPEPGEKLDRKQLLSRLEQRLTRGDDDVVEAPLLPFEPRTTRTHVDGLLKQAERLCAAPIRLEEPFAAASDAARDPTKPLEVLFEPSFFAEALQSAVDEGGQATLVLEASKLNARLEAARKWLEKPPEDARFMVKTAERLEIEPSKPGVRIQEDRVLQALLQAAQSPERRAALPVDRAVPPKLSTEEAQQLGIKGIVGHFSTHFPCCPPRVKNIQRIAELMNNTVVRPGETFSVNAAVGPRTIARGFVPAPSIEDGEMVDTVGGGISQFATTLYNAIFHAGYDIVSRQPHSLYFARYPMGHEATLSWPQPDLVFRNDTKAGLLITTAVTKTKVTVLLFGDNEGRQVQARVSGRRDLVEPELKLVADPKVKPDTEEVRQRGKPGWSVDVVRTVRFADGHEKTEPRRVTYRPEARVVALHPCRIPDTDPSYTGEPCPLPEETVELPDDDAVGAAPSSPIP